MVPTRNVVRFVNKNIFFHNEKCPSLQQRWRRSCRYVNSKVVGSWVQGSHYSTYFKSSVIIILIWLIARNLCRLCPYLVIPGAFIMITILGTIYQFSANFFYFFKNLRNFLNFFGENIYKILT
jgi:hypothetical protein